MIYLMSITRRVLAQPPEPEARDKLLDNNPDCIGIWKYFLRRGENRDKWRKRLEGRTRKAAKDYEQKALV